MLRLVATLLLGAVSLLGLLMCGLSMLRRWLLPPGLSVSELLALTKLNDPGAALTKFYEWRQDQWRKLAQGSAAAAVALVLAVVGTGLDSGVVIREVATQASGTDLETVTTHSSDTPLEPLIAAGILLLVSVSCWVHAFVLQRRMIRDIESM